MLYRFNGWSLRLNEGDIPRFTYIRCTAFKTSDGEIKASLSFHIIDIRVISTIKPVHIGVDDLSRQEAEADLPF